MKPTYDWNAVHERIRLSVSHAFAAQRRMNQRKREQALLQIEAAMADLQFAHQMLSQQRETKP